VLFRSSSRAEATDWLGNLTDDARAAAAELPAVTARLQEVKGELGQVRTALAESEQSSMSMSQTLEMVATASQRAADKQSLLIDARARQVDAETALRAEIDATAEAYFRAATAAEQANAGTQEHQDALDKKLDAEKKYVAAVNALRDSQWDDSTQKYRDEEYALKQSLEIKLFELENSLESTWLTEKEYAKQKADLEETFQKRVLELRAEAVAKSKELYGEDSREYAEATADKIDAELELKKAARETRKKWDDLMAVEKSGAKSAESMADTLREVGRAGQEGGEQAASAMGELGEMTEEATEQQKKLTEEQKKQARSKYFGEQYSGIQNQIASFKTLEEATDWAGQIVTAKNGRAYTNKDLMTMGGAGIAGQSAFTRSANKYAEQLYIKKLNELSKTTPQPGFATQKTMTVNLKSGGQTVAATLPEADAGRLLEVLRQAGMVTA